MPIALANFRRPIANVPLRWALTVPFVLLTVGATTLVGYLSHRNGEQTVTDLASQLMQEKGNQTVLYLERSLAVPHLINQLNADSIRLGQLPGFETTDPEPLEKFFWIQLLRFPDVTSIAMGNNRGGMVGSGRRLIPGPVTMNVYRTAQFARGKYTLSVTNTDGQITETKTISENYDARTRPWYETPAEAGEATWSPIYQYISDLQVLGISAGLPVYTDSGKLRGILTADINLKGLSHFLSGLKLSPSGQVFIVERSGFLVASSTNQPITETQAGAAERINAGESEDPTMRNTMAQLNARFDDLTRIGETQQFTIEQSQSNQWVRVIPFQDRYGLDWLIVMVVPESDFMAAIHANQATTLLLCLLTLGGAIGLGLLTADRLTCRFVQLNRASRDLAAGNLDRRLPLTSPIYEVNCLAQTFNQMADQLQSSFDRLQTASFESEEKFTVVFHASPDPVAIASFPEGRLLEANESLLQFFGYSHSEIIDRTATELGLWRDLSDREQYKGLLAQQGSVRNLEVEVCTNAGEVKTILLSAELRMLEGQNCVLVVHRDISDRKAAELALQQSEERFREVAHTINQLFFVRAIPTGKYLYASPGYEKLWGRSLESLYENPDSWLDSVHPEDRARVLESVRQQAYAGEVRREYRIIRADGAVRWISTEISVVYDKTATLHALWGWQTTLPIANS
ncbi:MAG: PAS domain S-box protein [Leptolyngbyaceae cyanobacterium SL_7_1]|nr:PAS domain S-box protein [Leptolyngbyaceae cyanobacterium SL_7_1]